MKLQSVVKTKGGVRTLTLPFSTPIQNILVHDLTVKVTSLTCLVTPKLGKDLLALAKDDSEGALTMHTTGHSGHHMLNITCQAFPQTE